MPSAGSQAPQSAGVKEQQRWTGQRAGDFLCTSSSSAEKGGLSLPRDHPGGGTPPPGPEQGSGPTSAC